MTYNEERVEPVVHKDESIGISCSCIRHLYRFKTYVDSYSLVMERPLLRYTRARLIVCIVPHADHRRGRFNHHLST